MKIVKFFSTSLIATLVDLALYTALLSILTPVTAHFISASSGMVINFILQRKWVFKATRDVKTSFILSLIFTMGGILLGGLIIFGLTLFTFLIHYPLIAKMIAIGIVFFYNYVTKKIAFGDR